MIEELGIIGKWHIQVKNTKTEEIIYDKIIKNRLMNNTLNELMKVYIGTTPDLDIAYLAVGTGTTAITDTDTLLATEAFRTAPTTATVSTGTGEVTTIFNILDTEALIVIEEIGLFGGSTATASANSGKLISRILWHYDKTVSNVEIQMTRIDSVVRP